MDVKLYTISELSGILNLHEKTILRFIHEGKIKARKIGRAWMVSGDDLKKYCHLEFSGDQTPALEPHYDTISERINVSAVIEIREQNSEEASRISNSLMAMLNGESGSGTGNRFDFFYFPELEKGKYVFYGRPEFIENILHVFNELCRMKGR